MNALAEKTDVLKMTLQQLMELVVVELLDVKRILFSRYLPVREFIGSRYDQQAGRLKQPVHFGQKLILFRDVFDRFEADNNIKGVILMDWHGRDRTDDELERLACVFLFGVTDDVFVDIHAHDRRRGFGKDI